MVNTTPQINDQFTLALVLETGSYAAANIKTMLKLRPDLQDDVLILRDLTQPSVNPMTYEYEHQGNSYLMFRTATSKVEFMKLYDELQSRHDWDAAHDLLPMYRGAHVNGYLINHFTDSDGPVITTRRVEDFRAEWDWILANCHSKVQWTKFFWYFQSQADAALYRLQFAK